ncbi:MAG: DNA-directed RNA polymerase subunit L [Thermoplasmata archaeon]|nr:DNA-directed RNA polymerase subunit L [Thermoplasmata archaeon]
MKFILLEKDKNSIKIEVADADQTIIQPIIVELHKDKNVESAQIFQRHPVLDKPLIYVKMKSGKPETAIKKAVKSLSANFEKALGTLEKELK